MDNATKIRESIRSIAGKNDVIFPVAKVVSVEGETCTVSYQGLEFSDVRIASVVNSNAKNMLIKPKKDSYVLLCDLSNGKLRDLAVLSFSEIDTITINGGNLGGLIKIQELTDKLNKFINEVNSLVSTFNSHTHTTNATVGATVVVGTIYSPATPASNVSSFNKSDYEDEKIKH